MYQIVHTTDCSQYMLVSYFDLESINIISGYAKTDMHFVWNATTGSGIWLVIIYIIVIHMLNMGDFTLLGGE